MFCTAAQVGRRPLLLCCSYRHQSVRAAKEKSERTKVIRCHGELLYGIAPCIAALQAKRRKIYGVYQKPGSLEKKSVSKRAALDEMQLKKTVEHLKADMQWVEGTDLDRVTGNKPHQGIVLDVAPLNFRRMDPGNCKLSAKERDAKPIWILLDEVQDPMNLGAILRVSYYLGVRRVVTSLKRCCPLSPTVSKASSGVMEIFPVHSVSHLQNFLSTAKDEGWKVVGTSGAGAPPTDKTREIEGKVGKTKKGEINLIDCRDYIKTGPTLLIVGNEGHGLHSEVEAECDAMLTVAPLTHLLPGQDSLNVAVATGILLHSLQTPPSSQ